MNVLSFGQKAPKPQWEVKSEALWQEREALTRRIKALTEELKRVDAKLNDVLMGAV